MTTYLVVLELAPMRIDAEYHRLPLHCTLAFWFKLNRTVQELHDHIAKSAARFGTVDVQGTAIAFTSGAKLSGRVPLAVTKVELTPRLQALHLLIRDTLIGLGADFIRPEFLGESYKPHVTHVAKQKLLPGTAKTCDTICIVSAPSFEYDYPRRVESKISLV